MTAIISYQRVAPLQGRCNTKETTLKEYVVFLASAIVYERERRLFRNAFRSKPNLHRGSFDDFARICTVTYPSRTQPLDAGLTARIVNLNCKG